MNIRRCFVALALTSLAWVAAAEEVIVTNDFYRSETGNSVLAYAPGSVTFSAVKGKDMAANEMLALIRTRLTRRTESGKVESTLQLFAALCERGTMRVIDYDGKAISPDELSFDKFARTSDSRMERFRLALCGGELSSVPPPSTERRSGWLQYLEGDRQALYIGRGGLANLDPQHMAVRVRLYELGGAQLGDGQRFDGRDVVWVIDCSAQTAGVAYERVFARVGNQTKTVTTLGSDDTWKQLKGIDVGALKFASANSGSIQARFLQALCASRPESRSRSNDRRFAQ